ncbi:MAG TPA: oligosaccharide flippase family protein [Magnetospirillum sp.]|nr:oligosaccharide flippase family protein [Magnetospirillum sp.]
MAGFRRAFLLNSVERYLCLTIGFLTVTVVSRLLSPAEVGLSAIGTGLMTVILALREFATAEFLILRPQVTREDVRTAFSTLFCLYVVVAVVLMAASPWIAEFYHSQALEEFLAIVVVAGLLETCAMPITALLRRDLAFGTLAVVTVSTAVVGAAVTVGLAASGEGFLSFAWAWLAAAATTVVLTLCFRPAWWIFRPCLRSWRAALNFGGYNGAMAVLGRAYEALPQLVLGGILSASAAGLYNRASTICGLPDRFVISGVFTVAFPALAAEARQGGNLKASYLRALGYITVVYWPALAVLALLAHPVVRLLLGADWLAVVPLVQIMCAASLFWFPVILTAPILAAVNALRDSFLCKLVSMSVCAAVLTGASFAGITAMALSQFFTSPFQMLMALYVVRRRVFFRWSELLAGLWKSAVVCLCSMAGPSLVIGLAGFRFDLPWMLSLVAAALAAVGWLGGLFITAHPFLAELSAVLARLKEGRKAPQDEALVVTSQE